MKKIKSVFICPNCGHKKIIERKMSLFNPLGTKKSDYICPKCGCAMTAKKF